MANTNCLAGFRCPKCGSEEPFDIDVRTTIRMYDEGSDYDHDGYEWEDGSRCVCVECSHEGTVGVFQGAEPLVQQDEQD